MSVQHDDFPLPRLPQRKPDSHKGDFGQVLLIGGSYGMTGAIALAGIAALRSGAGLVRLAVSEKCLGIVAAIEPSYMTLPLPADEQGRIALAARDPLSEAIEAATAIGCGPGLAQSEELEQLVAWLYADVAKPAVFDADGLNLLARQPKVLASALASEKPPRVLTPHPGEFSRLTGKPIREVQANRESLAAEFAARNRCIVLLKGDRTVITDGQKVAINATGNPGMATGGVGDVLTGVIAAMLAQGKLPYEAARLGAHVHGLAGDLAAQDLGQTALIASDLPIYLPEAWEEPLGE